MTYYMVEKLTVSRVSVYSTLFWSHENRLAMRVKRRRTQVVNEYVSDMQPFERNIEVLYNVTRVEQYSRPKAILMFHLLSLVSLVSKTSIEGWKLSEFIYLVEGLKYLCCTVTTVLEEALSVSITEWPPLRLRSHWVTGDGVLRKECWRWPPGFSRLCGIQK